MYHNTVDFDVPSLYKLWHEEGIFELTFSACSFYWYSFLNYKISFLFSCLCFCHGFIWNELNYCLVSLYNQLNLWQCTSVSLCWWVGTCCISSICIVRKFVYWLEPLVQRGNTEPFSFSTLTSQPDDCALKVHSNVFSGEHIYSGGECVHSFSGTHVLFFSFVWFLKQYASKQNLCF